MNWGMVGALAGVVAVFEVPSMYIMGGLFRWARETDRRIERLEERVWSGFMK